MFCCFCFIVVVNVVFIGRMVGGYFVPVVLLSPVGLSGRHMTTLAVIAARAGSKRLPGKNMMLLNNFPLIHYTLVQAKYCSLIDHIIVTTDDKGVKAYAKKFGFYVVDRPNELCTDVARSEDVIIHAVKQLQVPISKVVLLQPTSPLRAIDDINNCIMQAYGDNVVSVSEICNFAFKPNGAVYVWQVSKIMEGNWKFLWTYVMPPDRSVDIDTIDDLNRAQEIMDAKNRV